jgi:toxin CcdB
LTGQFTVFRNKNARTRATYPLLVDVQSDLLEDLETRVVIPLTRLATLTKKPMAVLTPIVAFEGEDYVLLTPQLAGVARTELGTAVGSLANERQAIVAAVDFLVLGF